MFILDLCNGVNIKDDNNVNESHPLYHLLASSPFASPHNEFGASSLNGIENILQSSDSFDGFSVKIADLGNACWTVIFLNFYLVDIYKCFFSIIILLKTFKQDSIVLLKLLLAPVMDHLLTFGVQLAW